MPQCSAQSDREGERGEERQAAGQTRQLWQQENNSKVGNNLSWSFWSAIWPAFPPHTISAKYATHTQRKRQMYFNSFFCVCVLAYANWKERTFAFVVDLVTRAAHKSMQRAPHCWQIELRVSPLSCIPPVSSYASVISICTLFALPATVCLFLFLFFFAHFICIRRRFLWVSASWVECVNKNGSSSSSGDIGEMFN